MALPAITVVTSMAKTIRSTDASPEVKALIDKLEPWPLSNEEAWAIVDEHIGDLVMAKRAHKISSSCWRQLAEAALEALHSVNAGNPDKDLVRHQINYAFRLEGELCGGSSSPSGASLIKKPSASG